MDTFKLADTYLLKNATLGDVQALEIVGEVREFGPGGVIVSVQERGRDIMIVTSGRAKVETRSGDLVRELRAGDMIGELSFLDGHARSLNVVSSGTSTVLVIPENRLSQLLKERPHLAATIYRNIALALCDRLRDANIQVESLLVPQ